MIRGLNSRPGHGDPQGILNKRATFSRTSPGTIRRKSWLGDWGGVAVQLKDGSRPGHSNGVTELGQNNEISGGTWAGTWRWAGGGVRRIRGQICSLQVSGLAALENDKAPPAQEETEGLVLGEGSGLWL